MANEELKDEVVVTEVVDDDTNVITSVVDDGDESKKIPIAPIAIGAGVAVIGVGVGVGIHKWKLDSEKAAGLSRSEIAQILDKKCAIDNPVLLLVVDTLRQLIEKRNKTHSIKKVKAINEEIEEILSKIESGNGGDIDVAEMIFRNLK
jgi:hypothetical protein